MHLGPPSAIALCAALLVLAPGSRPPQVGIHSLADDRVPGPEPTGALARVAEANARFSLDLYAELAARPGNLAFSPYSVSSALAMALAGARGETADEMARSLHLELPREELFPALAALNRALVREGERAAAVRVDLANRLWGDEREAFRPEFARLLAHHFDGALASLDLHAPGAAATINAWVAERTRDRIRDLVQPDALASAAFVLTNAITFKGLWAEPFDPAATREGEFHVDTRSTRRVPMMHRNASFAHARGETYAALELAFAGERFALLILLPDDLDGLGRLERELTPEELTRVTAALKPRSFALALPRFELETRFELTDVLRHLGMEHAFGNTADFGGMCERSGVALSSVIHRVFVRVDEEGAEAAAATAVIGVRSARPAEFLVDHPFLFAIRDRESRCVLFLGRVVEP